MVSAVYVAGVAGTVAVVVYWGYAMHADNTFDTAIIEAFDGVNTLIPFAIAYSGDSMVFFFEDTLGPVGVFRVLNFLPSTGISGFNVIPLQPDSIAYS
jgi:hypothetical protein